jgi:Flp pilus assembly protein TadD
MAGTDLGVVLYNTGDVDGAVTAFSRAVELAPGLARAHESLGTALWRQGRKVEAARHLQRAVLLGSGSGGDVDLTVPRPGASGADGS